MLSPFCALLVAGGRPGGGGSVHRDIPDALARHLSQLPATGRYQSEDLVRSATADGRYVLADRPHVYRYRILDAAGTAITAGVVGSVAVDDPDTPLLPHEELLVGEADTRRRERRRAAADTWPILVVTPAELPDLADTGGSEVTVERSGLVHAVAPLADDAAAAVADSMSGHPLVIADGHHRHAVAQEHRARLGTESRPGPWDCIMAMVVGSGGRGLAGAAFHRVFDEVHPGPERFDAVFEVYAAPEIPVPPPPGAIGWWPGRGAPLLLVPRSGALVGTLPSPLRASGAAVARALLYPMIGVEESKARYEADPVVAARAARPGGAAVLIPPIDPQAVLAAAAGGHRFPPKATRFLPKPLPGILIRTL